MCGWLVCCCSPISTISSRWSHENAGALEKSEKPIEKRQDLGGQARWSSLYCARDEEVAQKNINEYKRLSLTSICTFHDSHSIYIDAFGVGGTGNIGRTLYHQACLKLSIGWRRRFAIGSFRKQALFNSPGRGEMVIKIPY